MTPPFARLAGLILLLITTLVTQAQLPDGSIAPDFTAEDINGVEHNLYSLLDQGKKVIIDFSATWCGPCWNYHNTGALEEIWETYGPDGTDEAYVFFIEGDDSTTQADLEGTGSATTGNWIDGTGYPIIDNGGSIFDDYAGAYYPTIYTVCPNRMLVESGQISAEDHAAILFANDCAAATLAHDVALLDFVGDDTGCIATETNVSIQMMNLGLDTLSSATIGMFVNGEQVGFVNWTGSLGTYGIEVVNLPPYAFNQDATYELQVISGDMNPANDVVEVEFIAGAISTRMIQIEILTDGWAEETGWVLEDIEGNVIAAVTAGSLSNNALFSWEIEVPYDGCYNFSITDEYGDGLFGSQWGDTDGYCVVRSVNEFPYADGDPIVSVILDYDGSSNFSLLSSPFSAFEDFGGSELFGCTDPSAANYEPEASFDDGSCVTIVGCSDIGDSFESDLLPLGIYPTNSISYLGETDWYNSSGDQLIADWVLSVPNTIVDPGSGVEYGVYSFEVQSITGIPDGVTAELSEMSVNGGEQTCLSLNGYSIAQGDYQLQVNGDMSILIFNLPFPIGTYTATLDLTVLSSPNPVSGCTYFGASNYNFIASQDNGSCIFSGCTDPNAVNYNALFNEDDNSCLYLDDLSEPSTCSSDVNGDGLVAVSDLLIVLGDFGNPCLD